MKKSYTKFTLGVKILFFALLMFTSLSKAQVGIGNTNPAASSMLDITSTEKGLLVPRMTTAQRTAITTPANSLLVYDTTEKAFYYYHTVSTSWVRINSASDKRKNYVLVKTAADFPAPVGGKITLVSNTFYEINGTINLTVPIDLNDAYVAGLDANEDVLSFPGGVIFKGSTGGSVRNITLKGAKAFEITGPGISTATSLLVQNTIIDGTTTSVGSISGLGLYFGNIVQFLNNANGITYSNIGNLLLNNQAWLDTNNGTFETFTGTFGLIEKVSGFSTLNGSDVAINVSSNPSVGSGVLLGTVFSGTTTAPSGYINKYTGAGTYPGYNFTNAWTVNCPGIPRESDDVATGDINLNAAVGSGDLTSFSGTGTSSRTKILGLTNSNNLFRFEKSGNNRIIYRGAKKRYFQVSASVSYQAAAGVTIILYIAKGNSTNSNPPTIIEQTKVYGRGTNGFLVGDSILALPIVGTVEIDKNEYIEIWAERFSGTGDMYTVSLNLTAR
jgi:hypothetical protein